MNSFWTHFSKSQKFLLKKSPRSFTLKKDGSHRLTILSCCIIQLSVLRRLSKSIFQTFFSVLVTRRSSAIFSSPFWRKYAILLAGLFALRASPSLVLSVSAKPPVIIFSCIILLRIESSPLSVSDESVLRSFSSPIILVMSLFWVV